RPSAASSSKTKRRAKPHTSPSAPTPASAAKTGRTSTSTPWCCGQRSSWTGRRSSITGCSLADPAPTGLQQVRLGGSGLRVSRLALGMMSYGPDPGRAWALDEAEAEPIIRRAVEAGFTFFDTADMYSNGASEELTGRLLRKFLPREQAVIATKVFYPTGSGPDDHGLSRKHILDSIDASLKRLQMDYVDLYQVHRWDTETPIEETMEALHDVIKGGKARYLGASTMRTWQFAKAQHV